MKVTPLTQQDAHYLLKPYLMNTSLWSDFTKAFSVEAENKDKNSVLWTLPETERTYYTVSLEHDESPYLLIGINSSLNISSLGMVAKVGIKMGTCCFKYFFTTHLFPKLKGQYPDRNCVYATAGTEKGKHFFEKLKMDPPSGVREITIEQNYRIKILYE